MIRAIVSLVALSVLVSPMGCATMFANGPDMIPVSSEPSNAEVKLDGVPVGRTPMTVAFQRMGEGVLTFELPGYKKLTYDLDKVVNGWFVVTLIVWLPYASIPFGILDLLGGHQGKFPEAPIFVKLLKSDE